MAINLPYLAAPGTVITALQRIRAAATPERVTADFVTTKLMIKGGTGAAIPAFLKKINFVASDGTPTELYKNFRNINTGGQAMAEAIKIGYSPLLESNEYFYLLPDKELLALIVQVTGLDSENKIVKMILGTINNLKSFADFENGGNKETKVLSTNEANSFETVPEKITYSKSNDSIGLNLAYTINLNLPATTDQAVFNAIFKSLKEHLLSHE